MVLNKDKSRNDHDHLNIPKGKVKLRVIISDYANENNIIRESEHISSLTRENLIARNKIYDLMKFVHGYISEFSKESRKSTKYWFKIELIFGGKNSRPRSRSFDTKGWEYTGFLDVIEQKMMASLDELANQLNYVSDDVSGHNEKANQKVNRMLADVAYSEKEKQKTENSKDHSTEFLFEEKPLGSGQFMKKTDIDDEVDIKIQESFYDISSMDNAGENDDHIIHEKPLSGLDKRHDLPEMKLIIRKEALSKATQHANEESHHEVGGVLLGYILRTDGITEVVITGIVRAVKAVSRRASLLFSQEAWADVLSRIDSDPVYSDDRQWRIVGWYHTHPSFGIFLSHWDLEIHKGFFVDSGHIALVIDPTKSTQDHGYFCWNKNMSEVRRMPDANFDELPEKEFSDFLAKHDRKTIPIAEIEIGANKR